jgi:hypothetical protein
MKTTVDIPQNELEDAIRFTGASTKKDAIVRVLEDFNRRKRMAELVRYSGTFSSLDDNDEIHARDEKRMKEIFGEDFEFSGSELKKTDG